MRQQTRDFVSLLRAAAERGAEHLLTMEDDLEAINKKLEVIVRRLFFESERGFLPCVVIDEDGPGDTGLRHDVLRRMPSGRITLGLKR